MADFAKYRRWLGVGFKSGGQLLVGGYESTTAYVVNLTSGDTFDLTISSSRWGLGLGGSGGAVIVLAFGVTIAEELHRKQINDWGVNISLTEKLISKSVMQSLVMSKNFVNIYKSQRALNSYRHVKTAMKDIEFFASVRNALHTAYAGFEASKKSGVIVIDIPLAGAGVEISAFLTRGTMYVDNATDMAATVRSV